MTASSLRFETALRQRWEALATVDPAALHRDVATDLPTDDATLTARFHAAARRRLPLLRAGETTALRLVHEAGDALPGVAIDLYGSYAVLWLRTDAARRRQTALVALLTAFGVVSVYVKRPSRQARTLGTTRREEVAPAIPFGDVAAPDPLWIEEHGLAFRCRLGDGLATGFYADQRDNRRAIRQRSQGRRVLNLFAYTGSFSVAAAAGGAAATLTVDIARPALAVAEENFRRNGLASGAHRFVAEDALVALRRAAVRGDRFDLIVVDPPSFATSKAAAFAVDRDYEALAAAAFAVLAPGGQLLACTNHRGTSIRKFHAMLRRAAAVAGQSRPRLETPALPLDFPVAPGEEPTMKAAWAMVPP